MYIDNEYMKNIIPVKIARKYHIGFGEKYMIIFLAGHNEIIIYYSEIINIINNSKFMIVCDKANIILSKRIKKEVNIVIRKPSKTLLE